MKSWPSHKLQFSHLFLAAVIAIFLFFLKALLDAEKYQESVNTFQKAVELAP
jgi:hypothetical protein